MSEMMQIDFLADTQLSERFASHFVPMVYRLKMGIVITNPLVEEIRNQYGITFSATWYALAMWKKNWVSNLMMRKSL